MTVAEMVGMGRCPYTNFWGKLSAADEEAIDDALALVNITHLSKRTIHTLSDGERQKTMIAKALAQDTPIIFLDEPTAFLDFPSKVEMMQLLHHLSRKTNKTIFLSTHDVELALQIADNIWLMEREKDIVMGSPEDLALDGTLNRFFGRKGIVFDEKSGLFRVSNDYKQTVRLAGKGVSYAMAQKALMRNGIAISDSDDIEISIFVDNDVYHISTKHGVADTATTINELLELVEMRLNSI